MNSKKLFQLVIIVFICMALKPAILYKVIFVYDGDTVLLANGEKIRYLGINTPEINHENRKNEFMSIAARNFNRKLVNSKKVKLEFDQELKDRYGRILAYVYLKNGQMVNLLLLRKGMAYVLFSRFKLKYMKSFLDNQQKAMQEKSGIWRRPLAVTEKYYLGNRRSFRFHRPDCPLGRKISHKNRIILKSPYDAFWKGLSPCKRCNPCEWQRLN